MQVMVAISLALNVLVLVPVASSLLLGLGWIEAAYGPKTPARGILLSIYLAILGISVALLFVPRPELVLPLLLAQILYKVTTPVTVGSLRNPVVVSNLGIAAVHAATVWSILPAVI
ncbi:hypothetical protein [Devosia sp.]|uniref:hypothetical protein n=1 Tax=Devosia sp. TaxID=1871048 RepID=UPI003BABBBEC